jgi:hypothetical protein
MNDTFDDPERERELERLLRDEAAAARRTPRRSFAERVVSALPERGAASGLRGPVVPGPRASAVARAGRLSLAAAIVAGLYGLWTWDTVVRTPPTPRTDAVATLPRSSLDRLRRLDDVDLTLSNPLLEEARRLGRDATSATGFLANRLPPTFRSALFSGL